MSVCDCSPPSLISWHVVFLSPPQRAPLASIKLSLGTSSAQSVLHTVSALEMEPPCAAARKASSERRKTLQLCRAHVSMIDSVKAFVISPSKPLMRLLPAQKQNKNWDDPKCLIWNVKPDRCAGVAVVLFDAIRVDAALEAWVHFTGSFRIYSERAGTFRDAPVQLKEIFFWWIIVRLRVERDEITPR